MKKIAALILLSFTVAALPLSADEFTDMVQALGVKAASVGTYDANVSLNLVNWHADRYTPQIWAERYAAEYGSISGYKTFVGVCHDYTVCAHNDIQANQRKYNNAGMIEFYKVNAHDNSSQIEMEKITPPGNGTITYTTGVTVRRYGTKNILTHQDVTGGRAKNHAWIWMQRDDGVWFWVDPTWSDFYGYVVWGYVANGEEINLKPDAKFCVEYPSHVMDKLPDPPARGPAIKPAPSTRVAQTQKPKKPSSSSSSSKTPSSSSKRQSSSDSYGKAVSIGVSKSLADFTSGNIAGSSFWDTFGGVSISLETGNSHSLIGLLQLDYYNLDKTSLLIDAGIGKQFGKLFAIYGGAGLGAATTAEGTGNISLDNISFAWKAFAGARFTFERISIRADVSYVGDSGVVLAAFVGWMF